MTRRLLVALLAATALLAGCGGDDGEEEQSSDANVAASVEEHLKYLDPDSSAVFAIDMRYEERNWKHLRDIASRGLRAYRREAGTEGLQIPPNLSGALNALVGYTGLSFDRDVKPLLDGYAIVGMTQRPVEPDLPLDRRDDEREPITVVVYRTNGDGNLREMLSKLAEGEELKPLEGYDDVVVLDDVAIVGDDTLVTVEDPDGDEESGPLLRAALDRARDGEGFEGARLADAQKAAGLEDPFLLMTGDTTIARAFVEEPSYQRALDEVPWLGAIRSLAGAIRLDEGGADLAGTVTTDPRALGDDDLPVAPAGDLDLPRDDAITGASRDQSFTTTFLSRTARALFADSDFAKAVEDAERDIGVKFEDEVLRQFSCPSMSRLQPADQRFGARSCVKDPERMRELLPKLSKHLPEILRTMARLDTEGLAGLLLVAPDAPLTPSFAGLAQIVVKPFEDGKPEETLYRASGLHDELATPSDEVVFGMIGDTFVVGSDEEMARGAAELSGERLDEPAASAIRIPFGPFAGMGEIGTSDEERAVLELLNEIRVSISADRSALKARGRLDVKK
ncbi:MAG TPA: hypothetical protein VF587_16495 [Solirubrobacteraceae bacterium]|jgi:hypothetical protein